MKILRTLIAGTLLGLTLTSTSMAEPEFVAPEDYVKYATVRLTADTSQLNDNQKMALVRCQR